MPVGIALARDARSDDEKLGAAATARALPAFTGTGETYRCAPEANDGTVYLDDVDYACAALRPRGPGYWVGTNALGITEVQSMG